MDLDWAGTDVAAGGAENSSADAGADRAAGVGAGLGAGARDAADGSRYLTDEEILGIASADGNDTGRDSSGSGGVRK